MRMSSVKGLFVKKIVSGLMAVVFAVGSAGTSYAQSVVAMPSPGTMVSLSAAYAPPLLKGIKVYRNDPFRFDFILDKGDSVEAAGQLKADSRRLIKYFLASLTIPEKDLWVNLSPYEKDRIVPEAFGQTEMGRDLLAQDYILKQITASVISPEGEVGRTFWAKVYAESQRRFGTTDIPVDTFNKVWIIPDKAAVYENKETAFVVDSRLRVMLEEDHLALEKSAATQERNTLGTNTIGSDIVREIVIPVLEKEVNEGKSFAPLRQVYQALILATWYKRKVKASLLGRTYVDQRKTVGIDIADKNEKEKIWQVYVAAFKRGAYSFIKEERDAVSGEVVPRKYFSGGMELAGIDRAMSFAGPEALPHVRLDHAMLVQTSVMATGPATLLDRNFFGFDVVTIYQELLADAGVMDLTEEILSRTYAALHGPQGVAFANDFFRTLRSVKKDAVQGVLSTEQLKTVFLELQKMSRERPLENKYSGDARREFFRKGIEQVNSEYWKGYIVDLGADDNMLGDVLLQLHGDHIEHVQGVDIEERPTVRKGPKLGFSLNSETNMLELSGKADVVVIRYALHHMTWEEQEAYLNKARRMLKPDGKIIIYEDTFALSQPPEAEGAPLHEKILALQAPSRQRLLLAALDTISIGIRDKHQPFPFTFRTAEEWAGFFQSLGYSVLEERYLGILTQDFFKAPLTIFVLRNDRSVREGRRPAGRRAPLTGSQTALMGQDGSAQTTGSQEALAREMDPAMAGHKGGIDLTPSRMDLRTAGSGGDMIFNIDPELLERMRRAAGVSPVIFGIRPLEDLQQFLGVTG